MRNKAQRGPLDLRNITIERNYTIHAEGSVKISYGNTIVICNASVIPGVPKFLKGSNKGWITAEYGMLPRSTNERMQRESMQGRVGGRTMEIQRLIGRSLRSIINLNLLNEFTLQVDCDVIQADGGTRTASITGACVAIHDAISVMLKRKQIQHNPLIGLVAAVSVGICNGEVVLDLEYSEDSNADTDMNVVMIDSGGLIEVQGTAENKHYTRAQLDEMLDVATLGIEQLFILQKQALNN